MVKEIGVKEDIEFKENKKMKQERQFRMELKYTSYKERNELSLIKSILENHKVVEEFRTLPNKEKW